MLTKTTGSAVYGVNAITIRVEVNNLDGSGYWMVGMPDNVVKESLQRIESALKCCGFHMPRKKLVINFAPADIRKTGAAFDLPIAIGILAASEQLEIRDSLESYVMMGELSLDGTLLPIKGSLPMAITSQKEGYKALLVPIANSKEAGMVHPFDVFGMRDINDVIAFLKNPDSFTPVKVNTREAFVSAQHQYDFDFADVKGQENIKRALEIAAAGGHNAILIGPPGAGKTMLAKRMATILPPLSLHEALETTKIYSVTGKLPEHATLIAQRPFRSPHHSVSDTALVGGGGIPQPGEISLAHNGVLFLDELPEFKRTALEVLRQPIEERKVNIARAKISLEFPAAFMLIASMNPCPCGFYNHPEKQCCCPPGSVQKYLNKVSGPLLDRIDLHVEVTPVGFSALSSAREGESSATIRSRVMEARKRQQKRFESTTSIYCNAQMNHTQLKQQCQIDASGQALLKIAMEKLNLSARAYDRILKVSRTIADLGASPVILSEHLAEAIQYRSLDREGWAG